MLGSTQARYREKARRIAAGLPADRWPITLGTLWGILEQDLPAEEIVERCRYFLAAVQEEVTK